MPHWANMQARNSGVRNRLLFLYQQKLHSRLLKDEKNSEVVTYICFNAFGNKIVYYIRKYLLLYFGI
jgi:hypothetical protein